MGGHVQGLGIIRTYGKNGIPCYLLDSNNLNICKHSKYCNKFIKYNSDQNFIDYLMDMHKKYNLQDWLLIPTDDKHVQLLSKNKKVLEKYYKVGVDDWNIVEKCYNKKITYQIVKKLGIDLPDTFYPTDFNDLINADIKFPCILKPAIMHKLYNQTRKKVYVCNNKNELSINYNKIISYIPPEEVIVQEIIPGDSNNQYSACFFYNRTKPVVSLLARRKRQYPLDFGSCTTFAETINDEYFLKTACDILNEINYWGLCEVEFKKDERTGTYKFLEINPRTWKWHYIANKSGSPFLMSMYNMIYYNREIIRNEWNSACWKDLITDTFVIMQLIFKSKFVKTNKKNVQYAVFDTEDLKPFIYELIYAPYLFFTR